MWRNLPDVSTVTSNEVGDSIIINPEQVWYEQVEKLDRNLP